MISSLITQILTLILVIYFFETGDLENALKYFENLIKSNSNFSLAYFNKGLVLNSLKKYKNANECFKRKASTTTNYSKLIKK